MFWEGFAAAGFGGGGMDALVTSPPVVEGQKRGKPRIGLALGGGAARGWSHLGVMRALAAADIAPDVIAGCSIGAVVGGCYACGKLDELEAFALSLTKRRVMGLLDFHISGSGLIAGDRLKRLLDQNLEERRVETLPLKFVTIATELGTGHEIWLTKGSLVEALRASYALPGVFDPVLFGGRWLMDGALVNPVPVTAARALGADLVICVNLNGDIKVRGTVIQSSGSEDDGEDVVRTVIEEPRRWALFGQGRAGAERQRPQAPGIATVMIDAFNITQDRIARSRLAGDPPDVMIAPKLAPIGLFEFHRAAESIELGRQATERVLPDIREIIEAASATTV
jgi:NTE family protein